MQLHLYEAGTSKRQRLTGALISDYIDQACAGCKPSRMVHGAFRLSKLGKVQCNMMSQHNSFLSPEMLLRCDCCCIPKDELSLGCETHEDAAQLAVIILQTRQTVNGCAVSCSTRPTRCRPSRTQAKIRTEVFRKSLSFLAGKSYAEKGLNHEDSVDGHLKLQKFHSSNNSSSLKEGCTDKVDEPWPGNPMIKLISGIECAPNIVM